MSKKLLGFVKYVFPLLVILPYLYFKFLTGLMLILLYIVYVFLMNMAVLYKTAGKIKYVNGDLNGAILWYERANKTGKLKPKDTVVYGYMLLKQGNIEKAEKLFKALHSMNLDNDSQMLVKSNYALVLWKKGQLDQAVELLEGVYKNFKTTALYGSLGFLLILKGDLDKSLEFNLEAYEYNNTSPVTLDNLGYTYYLRNENDKAEEIYKKLMDDSPSFPEAYYNYGLVLAKEGKYTEAIETTKKALNYELSFLSTVTRSEIEQRIEELTALEGGE